MITAGNLLSAKDGLGRLVPCGFPPRIALKLERWINTLNQEYLAIEKTRNALVERYGEKTEDGENYSITPDSANWDEFETAFAELVEQPIEIKPFEISLEALIEKTAMGELSVQDIATIRPLFKEE